MSTLLRRSYYSAAVSLFLSQHSDQIFGELAAHNEFDLNDLQKNSWLEQIAILKSQLENAAGGHLLFEYTIPRVGKRIDNVLIYRGIVFLLEFKVGESQYRNEALEQVLDYALDLKNFHKESRTATIVPMLVSTEARSVKDDNVAYPDRVLAPLHCNRDDLWMKIHHICATEVCDPIDPRTWESSIYAPTPTIIEAAQALYQRHSVDEISRSDAGAKNLNLTAKVINDIVECSKRDGAKAICFVTGVPGAGKTLAGLNIANARREFEEQEQAVFLSGNGPLVEVLQEALARDSVSSSNSKATKTQALRKVSKFVQNIHHFRDDALSQKDPVAEKVAIFDEAQRAWNRKQTSDFMRRKKGLNGFAQSEPEFLISVMDRHPDWAVIVCLIGGGQEINTGEAGLPEWFDALRRRFPHWRLYLSESLSDYEYTRGKPITELTQGLSVQTHHDLHLAVSLRSFRSEKVSGFVKALLDTESETATSFYRELSANYPIVITRDLAWARKWVKRKARGSERYGLLASSGARRLRSLGIWVQSKIDAKNWFLNDRTDVRSSFYLEETATEFDIQGLELDWTVVAWDADFRYSAGKWEYHRFTGNKWTKVGGEERQLFLKNAYRVLLTRARQGMVIYVPKGESGDKTRLPAFYDGTYEYLTSLGVISLDAIVTPVDAQTMVVQL